MASKPAIVILHGAWHQPSHIDNVIEKLQGQGYEVKAPATASVADTAVSDVFKKDVSGAKKAIQSFTQNGKNVVVFMHSYGGVYGSEAVAEVCEESKSSSGNGRVVHLFYISAIILNKGTDVMEDSTTAHVLDLEDGLLHHLEPYHRFYATTPPNVARKAISQVKPQAAEAFAAKQKYRGWADYDIPVTYLSRGQDQALTASTDLSRFVRRFETAGVKNFVERRIDCDHSPWLSAEGEFMRLFEEVLENASKPA